MVEPRTSLWQTPGAQQGIGGVETHPERDRFKVIRGVLETFGCLARTSNKQAFHLEFQVHGSDFKFP